MPPKAPNIGLAAPAADVEAAACPEPCCADPNKLAGAGAEVVAADAPLACVLAPPNRDVDFEESAGVRVKVGVTVWDVAAS